MNRVIAATLITESILVGNVALVASVGLVHHTLYHQLIMYSKHYQVPIFKIKSHNMEMAFIKEHKTFVGEFRPPSCLVSLYMYREKDGMVLEHPSNQTKKIHLYNAVMSSISMYLVSHSVNDFYQVQTRNVVLKKEIAIKVIFQCLLVIVKLYYVFTLHLTITCNY